MFQVAIFSSEMDKGEGTLWDPSMVVDTGGLFVPDQDYSIECRTMAPTQALYSLAWTILSFELTVCAREKPRWWEQLFDESSSSKLERFPLRTVECMWR